MLASIIGWGDRWLGEQGEVPMVVRHRDCGRPTHAVVGCAHCGGA